MKIELEGCTPDTLAERVIGQLADQMEERVEEAIQAKIDSLITPAVKEATDEAICKQAVDYLTEYLSQPFQPTTTWGEKKGEPQTIGDRIVKHIDKMMLDKVDSKGRSGSSCSSYGPTHTRIGWIAVECAKKEIQGRMEEPIATAMGQAEKLIQEQIATFAAKATEAILKKRRTS